MAEGNIPLALDPQQSSPARSVQNIREAFKKKKPRVPRETKRLPMFTLENAFSSYYCPAPGDDSDSAGLNSNISIERGIRSVACVLESLSDGGNRPMDGFAATGLAHALMRYADEIGRKAGRNE